MTLETILVPDLGGVDQVRVIELCFKPGDMVEEEDSLIVLESDKATMDVPSSSGGVLHRFLVREGDEVSTGDMVAELKVESTLLAPSPESMKETALCESDSGNDEDDAQCVVHGRNDIDSDKTPSARGASSVSPQSTPKMPQELDSPNASYKEDAGVYAGPSVRLLARELGVDLSRVDGSGLRGRVTREDLNNFVQQQLSTNFQESFANNQGYVERPINFAEFGRIEKHKLTKIQSITSKRLQESWAKVPHVTQFDDAEITELEEFRKSLNIQSKTENSKINLTAFLIKAVFFCLKSNPKFNRSLVDQGLSYIQKDYFHIGIAVDTEKGLLVPVIRDVDSKGILELANEIGNMAVKARNGMLLPDEMRGGCFTISSLGAMGGSGFTPIINPPEVAILGVARAKVQPFWDGDKFIPKLYLPLALSYDHRIINGADGGAFMNDLVRILSDIRLLVL